jgi:myo-inositol catabolism protein IolS
MEFRELGKSGIKVSAVGLGTWQWGSREWGWEGSYGRKDVLDAFQKALELGINFIDTAEVYGGGKSEKLVGEAIRGHRDEVVIASKVWPLNFSYGRLLRAVDRSLARLGVDVIDLYQLHWPNPFVPIGTTMRAMKKLVQDGRIRCAGISNFSLQKTKAAQNALAPVELASNQVKYNLLERDIETKLLPYARDEKISIIAYSPLAKGLLTGKYRVGSSPSSFVQRTNAKFSSRNLNRLEGVNRLLSELATTHGKTSSQIALNWLIGKEQVIAIPGVKRGENVVDDAGGLGWRLSADEVLRLENAVAEVGFDRLSGVPNALRALIPH